jgi:periplasmic protein CpxP/Spy
MKITFRILALAALFLIGFANAQAQRGDWNASPEDRAEKQTATMKEKLSLSEKQAEKVKAINLKYANKMKETRDANTEGDWTAMRETMGKIRQEQDAELKTVLTTEQFETWNKYQEEQRSQRGQRGGEGKKGAPKEKKS